jgi:hypothetical protein
MSMVSGLFRYIEELQGQEPWGSVLDAGAGVNSAEWMTALSTTRWTAVTAAPGHARQVREAVAARLRPQDRLLVGNWMDPALLAGEVHDVVLADYLIGAVEGFSPYFQEDLLRRLKPMVGRRLYITGLDPYVVGEVPDAAARCVREIGRLRDVCLLLADETPYREFPAEWVRDRLMEAGFRVLSAKRFSNRYRARWVDGQLDMALRRLPKIADRTLAEALAGRIEALRTEGHKLAKSGDGLHVGFDYVIAAEPA